MVWLNVVMAVMLFAPSLAATLEKSGLSIRNNKSMSPGLADQIGKRIELLDIPFLENVSQLSDNKVKYYSNILGGRVFVSDNGISYVLREKREESGIRATGPHPVMQHGYRSSPERADRETGP